MTQICAQVVVLSLTFACSQYVTPKNSSGTSNSNGTTSGDQTAGTSGSNSGAGSSSGAGTTVGTGYVSEIKSAWTWKLIPNTCATSGCNTEYEVCGSAQNSTCYDCVSNDQSKTAFGNEDPTTTSDFRCLKLGPLDPCQASFQSFISTDPGVCSGSKSDSAQVCVVRFTCSGTPGPTSIAQKPIPTLTYWGTVRDACREALFCQMAN